MTHSADAKGPARSDKELALWMLDRIDASEKLLAARRSGSPAEQPDDRNSAFDRRVLETLYRGPDAEDQRLPAALVGIMDAIGNRDLLAGREEVIEKALAAYISRHPNGNDGLPTAWQTTIAAARAEVEGRTTGNFAPNFVATLAKAARDEMVMEANRERSSNERDSGRGR